MKQHTLALLASFLASSSLFALSSGIDLSHRDKNVRFQDDLYLAVNGTWLAKTEIPADRSNYGAFNALDDLSNERIRALIEACAAGTHPKGSDAQKVGDLYRSFMNEKQIESLGTKPLAGELKRLDSLATHDEVLLHLGYLAQLGVQGPFAFFVGQDDKDSTRHLAHLYQYGLALPDRDYYLKDDPKFLEARKAYRNAIESFLQLLGQDKVSAERDSAAILAFETRLAEAQWSKVELRNPEKNYNKMAVSELTKLAPDLKWNAYFTALGIDSLAEVNVCQPSFLSEAAKAFLSTPVETLRAYLKVRLVDNFSTALPAAFDKTSFEFHGKTLAGIPQDRPRWKKAVALISGDGAGDFGALGDVVGRLYVEKHFPSEAKTRMDQLVGNLLNAYRSSISELSWMTEETKVRALEKLSKYTTKIGYPTQWRDYSALQIDPNDLVGNLLASARLEYRRGLDKLGKPTDRNEWGMTPQTVNAYYNPGMNEIVFPAAILQPPFFNAEADDAVNYGAIGAVIGHEISHGFDDQGCQYDGDGNLRNWWTEADAKAFKEITTKLVAQFAAYEALPGKFVNGEFTLGENIADLSGVSIAFKAYKLSLADKPSSVIDGFTGEQRFFLGWSQVWRRKYRDAELAKRLLTDPHSPSQFRANGPIMNSDAFMQAFGVKEGDKLFKPAADRIRLW